jgi:DNA-binding MarR family transcriptional regulator
MVVSKMENVHQSKIAKMLALEKSSVSRNVKRLLSTGLITTQESKELKATNKGKQLMEQLIPAWENAKKEVDEILGEDGQQALELLKRKLTKL